MLYGLRRVRLPFSEVQLGFGAGASYIRQSLRDGDHAGVGPAGRPRWRWRFRSPRQIAIRLLWGIGA